MESDDQGQVFNNEKFNGIHINGGDNSLREKVLSIRSEESIFNEASKKIDNFMKSNIKTKKDSKELNNDNGTGTIDCSGQKKLKKQVQTGEITPFQAIEKQFDLLKTKGTFNKSSHLLDLEKYLRQQAELAKQRKRLKENSKASKYTSNNAVTIKKPKLLNIHPKEFKIAKKTKIKANKKKLVSEFETSKSLNKNNDINYETEDSKFNQIENSTKEAKHSKNEFISCNSSEDNTKETLIENTTNIKFADITNDSESEYVPSDEQIDSADEGKSCKKRKSLTKSVHTKRVLDDGNEEMYRERVEKSGYPKDEPLHKIDNLFKIPQSIWKKLYKYQKVSVQWLWELHLRGLGGLLGDEMGLGKTVQVIAFLAGLDCSELLSDGGRFRGLGPTIIVCPATLMEQWVKHFHEWWPILRVAVLHQCGTYNGNLEYLMHSLKSGGVLITSYSGMLIHKDLLVTSQWHYVILDEGHKIRNPQAKISKAVKEFSTPHRLLLTGSPMQNSLKELWSLFDFILPGKLGTLPAFLEHCAAPITRGGYTNASPLQEAIALQVATMLRDTITPYMLRRTKNDVQHHLSLPEKNEQVLFCSLTGEQKELYKEYLRSADVSFILHEKSNSVSRRYRARLLIALSVLRKICNHPDLFLYTNPVDSDEDIDVSNEALEKFGYWKRSGKMIVVRSLLKIWKKQGHRVLLFTQGRQMMHVLESLVQSEEYSYLRMDGITSMSQRQETIRLFNKDPSYFVFLLTTRVGGLGVNLTGANRVVIYDPDWNPATDAQARARAWRIGQNKKVTIYRLITAGTIEEKMYHRQIFKILLANKVLEDPRQHRLFKTSDLVELFNFNESIDNNSSEIDQLFGQSRLVSSSTKFSPNKIEKMRKLAATLSKNISQNTSNSTPVIQIAHVTENVSSCHNNNIDQDILKHNYEIFKDNLTKEGIRNESNLHKKNEDILFSAHQESTNDNNIQNKISKDIEYNTDNILNNKLEDEDHTLTSRSNSDIKIHETSNKATVQCLSNDANITEILDRSNETVTCNVNINEDTLSKLNKNHCKEKRKRSSRLKEHAASALFEGERVSHLIGRRLGRSLAEEPKPIEDDQYVLEKLFAKASVTSAFQHETVLSNSEHNSDDKNPMQRLARETAQENMDSIRKSRKWCWKPMWNSMSPKNY
ncbi:DNA excision repair protein ERCC-6-like isoform X1 [Bombus vosnesenskii]|uniref:DNA repair and recombination protein RAD54-like n=3 Tax=Bombus vosnesenskii TaxID=207650 RepID=A0A6J3L8U6_9HYME|nr:DNA excision repair protein ERCC-6-like isoform X1 [Bombus vosnesenskii]